MLLRCPLVHKSIIPRHLLYLLYLCPWLDVGLFLSYLCDLFFIFTDTSLAFVLEYVLLFLAG